MSLRDHFKSSLFALSGGLSLAWLLVASPAEAGLFDLPHFVEGGNYAIGLEPEFIFTDGAGIGLNLKYTQGVSSLSDATAIVGVGSGPRNFRLGGNYSFDFFPDTEGQPGIGLAFQGIYYRIRTGGSFDATAIPYLHKTFSNQGSDFEPFVGVPIGVTLANGEYKTISSIAIGSLFQASEHLSYVVEFGMDINNTQSYFSGGIVYYH